MHKEMHWSLKYCANWSKIKSAIACPDRLTTQFGLRGPLRVKFIGVFWTEMDEERRRWSEMDGAGETELKLGAYA